MYKASRVTEFNLSLSLCQGGFGKVLVDGRIRNQHYFRNLLSERGLSTPNAMYTAATLVPPHWALKVQWRGYLTNANANERPSLYLSNYDLWLENETTQDATQTIAMTLLTV